VTLVGRQAGLPHRIDHGIKHTPRPARRAIPCRSRDRVSSRLAPHAGQKRMGCLRCLTSASFSSTPPERSARQPTFLLVAVLTPAFGIGATTAMFSQDACRYPPTTTGSARRGGRRCRSSALAAGLRSWYASDGRPTPPTIHRRGRKRQPPKEKGRQSFDCRPLKSACRLRNFSIQRLI
jgi:hypothetical protein